MSKIKNKHRLKHKEIRSLEHQLKNNLSTKISIDNRIVESGKIENIEFIFLDSEPCFFIKDNTCFFTIIGIQKINPTERFVIVDMGAIKFVTNGADVMAPGIVKADPVIQKNDSIYSFRTSTENP